MNLSFLRSIGGPRVQQSALKVSKYAPEILTAVGITGVVASTVLIARATLKLPETVSSHETRLWDAKFQASEELANELSISGDEVAEVKLSGKQLTGVYAQTSLDLVKLYGPGVSLSIGSIISILAAHGIMKRRTVALLGAYKAVEAAFASYRERVIEEFGEDKDRDFRLGFKTEKRTDEITGKKVSTRSFDPNHVSQYAKFFDEGNENWKGDPEYNLLFLKNMQNWMNDKLHKQGYLFLNDVYDSLGFERTAEGQLVGWWMGKELGGDLHVDFNIYNADSIRARDFVNGLEASILLDFNVDGVILDLM